MDLQVLSEFLKDFGFPIVCCGALFWQQNKTMKDFADRMEDSFKALTGTVEKNTEATIKLVTTVEVIEKVGANDHG